MLKSKLYITIPCLFLSACIEPEFTFSAEAERLGEMSMTEIKDEFRRLGELPEAPGPIPIGSAEVKAGLIALQSLSGLSKAQQDLAHALVWSGKDFYRDESKPCNTTLDASTFWLENRFIGAFSYIEKLEGAGAGTVYYDDASWIGDGYPVIAVDYASVTPTMGFMRNEMRIAKWDKANPNNSTYLGIMWIKIEEIKIPVAFFIPDKTSPYVCL